MEENEGYTQPLNSFVEGERNVDVLRPYGVFGVIAPFNFPVALSVGMFSSALIAGNTVVFKPSEESPSTGAVLAEIVQEAGLPAGAFNLVHGGPDTGRALVDAPVDGVAFTGSAEVGREIARKMQEGAYARPALTEMGGKNPAIVTASADVDAAAEGVARSAFGLSGQKCSACSRAIVVDSVHDEFVERLAARAAELRLGDPSDRDAFVGPVINESSVERYTQAVAAAERDGRVAAGGARPDLPGHFVEPTVVAGLPHGHALERDELFLPFVTVTRVGSFDEALAEANAPAYGLTAGHLHRRRGREGALPRRDRGGRGLREPARGRHHGRMAGHADVLRLEVERLDGQGRPRRVVPAAVHARAEPDNRGVSSATRPANASSSGPRPRRRGPRSRSTPARGPRS